MSIIFLLKSTLTDVGFSFIPAKSELLAYGHFVSDIRRPAETLRCQIYSLASNVAIEVESCQK